MVWAIFSFVCFGSSIKLETSLVFETSDNKARSFATISWFAVSKAAAKMALAYGLASGDSSIIFYNSEAAFLSNS